AFVPCKMIQEQAAAGEYDKMMKEKLKARGIPAMGVFGGEGRLLHQIGGWESPEDTVGKPDPAKPGEKPAKEKGVASELQAALAAKPKDASADKEEKGKDEKAGGK